MKFWHYDNPLSPLSVSSLDKGEASVIQIALEIDADMVCIDEWKGRRAAMASGLKVIGALGLLAKAKKLEIITALKPFAEKAVSAGIRYDFQLINEVINAVDE